MNHQRTSKFRLTRKNARHSVALDGEKLKHFRRQLGMTQEEFANAIDYSVRLVRKAEHGGRVDAKTLRTISDYINCNGLQTSFSDLSLCDTNNKSIVLNWFDRVFVCRDDSATDEIVNEAIQFYFGDSLGTGIREFKYAISTFLTRLGSRQISLQRTISESDWTVVHWAAFDSRLRDNLGETKLNSRISGNLWIRTSRMEIVEARI